MSPQDIVEKAITEHLAADVLELISLAFPDDENPSICARTFLKSRIGIDYNLVALRENKKVIAAAFVGVRSIRWFGRIARALTIGPLAVHPGWQRMGYGGRLLAKLQEAGKSLGAELIYLQGVEGYYRKFGFFPIPIKSKVIINCRASQGRAVTSVRPMNVADIWAVSSLYEQVTQDVNLSAVRTIEEWEWLVTSARETWYFSNPQVVLSERGVIGYFCVDLHDRYRIREFVAVSDQKTASVAIAGLVSTFIPFADRPIEVMTWQSSPLTRAVIENYNGEITRSIRQNAGQLLKPITDAVRRDWHRFLNCENNKIFFEIIENSFVFQGDNF